MVEFTQVLANGILLGGVFVLISVGLTLIFGVLNIVNFAQGEFVMVGMYAALAATSAAGISIYFGVVVAALVSLLLGAVTYALMVRKVIGTNDQPQILLTLGLSTILQGAALAIWGPNYHTPKNGLALASVHLGPVYLSTARIIAFCAATGLSLVTYVVLRRTRQGRAVRAAAENRDVAALMGIDVDRVFLVSFSVGIALAGIAGALIIPFLYAYPTVGVLFVMTAYVVVVLGGLGNVRGAIVAGLAVGEVQVFTGTYWAQDLTQVVTFLLFVLVLLVRPYGLFGKAVL